MNILVIDSNIIFSAALNIDNEIGQFIMSSDPDLVKLFAPDYLRMEIERYLPRIAHHSKLSDQEVRRIISLIYTKLSFISDEIIPFESYSKALKYVRDVDMDDLAFVALNEYLNGLLWTGDKKLYKGLKSKGYERVVTFRELKNVLT